MCWENFPTRKPVLLVSVAFGFALSNLSQTPYLYHLDSNQPALSRQQGANLRQRQLFVDRDMPFQVSATGMAER